MKMVFLIEVNADSLAAIENAENKLSDALRWIQPAVTYTVTPFQHVEATTTQVNPDEA